QYFKMDLGARTRIIAVEPAESAVLSGENPGKHGIQGIGAGFVPAIYDAELIDGIEKVSTDEAFELMRAVAKKTGISCGISSGANLAAAIRIAKKLPAGSTVTTVFPDRVDRYLSLL
ncbi:MAG TPA: pyridoxal-phosphate dependent enzyme, partial [candidate division Zixibacteria bacterium]|nr:pyridoxal-phosphate dependent enzyme [candidate division Zixibacteria bacterium]